MLDRRIRPFAVLVCTLGLVALSPGLAQLPLGAPLLVNSVTTGDQQHPGIGMRDDGRFLVVWDDGAVSNSSKDIMARVFDASGTPFSPFAMSQVAGVNQEFAVVSMNGNGDSISAWISSGQVSGSAHDGFARRTTSNGSVLANEQQVNATSSHDVAQVRVSRADNDTFVACWLDVNAPTDRYCRRFAADGTAITGDLLVNQLAVAGDNTAVVAAPDGSFVVAYATSTFGGAILARCFAADGTALGNEFLVAESSSGVKDAPALGMDKRAAFVVVWREDGLAGHYEMRLFDPDCTPRSADLPVDVPSTGDLFAPSVDMAPDGAFVVAWAGTREDADRGVTAREFDRNGAPAGPQFVVNVDTVGAQESSQVAMGQAIFAVTFTSRETGSGFSDDVYVRRYQRRVGMSDDFESGDLVYWSAVRP